MYDYLKALFGTDENGNPAALTFEQLEQAIAANKELKLVNLADGGYVSKDKFDAKETELTGVKQQLATANTTIQSYKDMDIDGIKAKAGEWETKYNTDTQALKDQLAATEYGFAVKEAVAGLKFSSESAKKAFVADLAAKKLPFQEGKLLGLEDFAKTYKETDPDAFLQENDDKTPVVTRGGGGGGPALGADAALRAAFGLPDTTKKE